MKLNWKKWTIVMLCCLSFAALWVKAAAASEPVSVGAEAFPRSLDSYNDADLDGIWAILKNRVQQEHFNLFATLIFVLAIAHTFMAARFLAGARGRNINERITR